MTDYNNMNNYDLEIIEYFEITKNTDDKLFKEDFNKFRLELNIPLTNNEIKKILKILGAREYRTSKERAIMCAKLR